MKFQITLKDPDGVYEGILAAVRNSKPEGILKDTLEEVESLQVECLSNIVGKWFDYLEYVTLEIDTDLMTATVVENK